MPCPKAALFDLDETISRTLQAPDAMMTARLLRLSSVMPLSIITGRDFAHIQREFLDELARSAHADALYILPNGASEGYRPQNGTWEKVYVYELSDEEKRQIRAAVEASLAATQVLEGLPCYGERYVDKGSMLSFAILGVPLPPEIKRTWDPGNVRRTKLWADLAPRLPEFDVAMGGMTAIDITRKGINKAFGVRWLSEHLGIPCKDMLYVGDALFEGGNDHVVIETGVQTRVTSGPEETLGIVDELLSACHVNVGETTA